MSWDDSTKTVISRKGETEIDIPTGQNMIYVNQKAVATDTAAVLANGRTYLPLRAVLEAYGYKVDWNGDTRTITAFSASGGEFTPFNINGGTTGVFSRKQLVFSGFNGIQADVTLPTVTLADPRECPYVYFGFDWANDAGNAEGGFQFIGDSGNPNCNKWTVFLRQGSEWRWGDNIVLEQGSKHHLKFYSESVLDQQTGLERTDLVIELDGREVVRKASAAADFSSASVKSVIAMGMLNPFDGTNCLSRSEGAKIENPQVLEQGAYEYADFGNYSLYSDWRPAIGPSGTWFGTADCIPSYLHFGSDGSVSIYKGE